MNEPVGKTEDELWAQVNQDRASTRAESDEPIDLLAAPAAAAPVADEADPLAALPEPTRKLIQGLDEKFKKADERIAILDRQLGTANGTIGNLKQRLDESQVKLRAIDPVIEATEAARKAAEAAAATEREQKRAQMREQFSELAEYVDMAVADAKPAVPAPSQPAEPAAPAATEATAPDTVQILSLQLELSDKAPGWRQTKDTPEFSAWLATQSADVQNKAVSWNVDEIAGVFNSFDQHKKAAVTVAQVEQDRQKRLNRGIGIQGRGSSVGSVDLSEDAAWEKVKRDREKSRASA